MTSSLSEELEKRALRILPFTDGGFVPSEPPQLLSVLTDYDLVVAKATALQKHEARYKARYKLDSRNVVQAS